MDIWHVPYLGLHSTFPLAGTGQMALDAFTVSTHLSGTRYSGRHDLDNHISSALLKFSFANIVLREEACGLARHDGPKDVGNHQSR